MKILEEYVSEVLSSAKGRVSAGFVVVRRFSDGLRILGLKRFSRYDLPKGHMEDSEAPLQTAIRETEEEAGITHLFFTWGLQRTVVQAPHKTVVIYIAETDQDGRIDPNPVTQRWEHHGIKWLTFEEAREMDFGYLSEVIDWAASVVESESEPPLSL